MFGKVENWQKNSIQIPRGRNDGNRRGQALAYIGAHRVVLSQKRVRILAREVLPDDHYVLSVFANNFRKKRW